jgi:hypothetical protein
MAEGEGKIHTLGFGCTKVWMTERDVHPLQEQMAFPATRNEKSSPTKFFNESV